MEEPRILAIDFGEKRIGLAISIPKLNIPEPLKTIERKDLWAELDEIFKSYNIDTVVIGLPLHTDGREAKNTPIVKELAAEISVRYNIPVKLWDERFTTKSAEQLMHLLGKKPSKDKANVDRIAAAIILDEYLSSI
ncbi:MAG: Holliday junction resolvase RuvX [Candidatus Stahlbacteria bacterium]|nr:Holliday junction resolvase RuvX [Candidatus Stahlbacteria bacterium]